MGEFADKVAVITGSSGIGLGAALHFASAGARVFCCGIDDGLNDKARTAAEGLDIAIAKVDVADADQVEAWITSIAKQAGGIDILVNAAAIQTYGDTESTDVAHWRRVMSINLDSCFLTSHFAYPHMKSRGSGAIVNVTSIAGSRVHPFAGSAYATSKTALSGLTREMAADFGPHGIRVNSIAPGEIDTSILSPGTEEIVREIPLRRLGEPEEVASMIYFLCSDQSRYVSGGEIHINGGQHV